MPLEKAFRDQVLAYCDRDLPSAADVTAMFDFLEDEGLRNRIEAEFHSARYIYKLGEALNVADARLHGHVKFQIVQYAGIYEAIIVHLLWTKFVDHLAVTSMEFHKVYKKAASLPSTLHFATASGEEISLCVHVTEKTNPFSIKFDDKVDAAVAIGFVDESIGEDIKSFYKLRNGIHLESAIKNQIKYELDSSHLAYRRMKPFTEGIRGYLRNGKIPGNASLKKRITSSEEGAGAQTVTKVTHAKPRAKTDRRAIKQE
ncbi:TTC39/IML2 family protein [Mesorhizobium sp. ESP-6-2]|uniref:TTC39/IML2 family protein n=1 Tax=Mesorhizobium sp. ESP-6-2 TaxID=2876625 RepID=UPI001CCD2AB3|nr:TTC39/IML2 family protein [Mesorhizobium sp. ESP-6-2]MBZ9810715.1 TTC39/IML2 family protein [Mesorhizobium sp. ESP-6-2]